MHKANLPKQSLPRTSSIFRSISPGGNDIGMLRMEGDGYLTHVCTTGIFRTTGAKIVQPLGETWCRHSEIGASHAPFFGAGMREREVPKGWFDSSADFF